MYKLEINKDIKILRLKVVELLNNYLSEANKSTKKTLLLLSGGSNIEYLDEIKTEFMNSEFTICVLDERFTDDPTKNNLAQIETKSSKFYEGAMTKGCKVIDTKVKDGETRDGLAKRFNNELVKWLNENPKRNIIITAGVGPDGHISGMKPLPNEEFKKLFESGNQEELVVGYNASSVDSDNPERVTTTMNFFRRVKDTAKFIVYAVNKTEALQKTKEENGELNETPARILNEMKNVTIFSN